MKLNNLPSEFQKALPILEKIKAQGYDVYFVGGSVRDVLLNRPIHDVDIATSAYPEEIKHIFPRTVDIGIEHGTVLVLDTGGEYEVTTFRTEDVYVDYRRPSHVQFVRSLEEDLKRRDFTINAFALSENGQIIDCFSGLDDLDKQIIRAVGKPIERFTEDALRIMRGFRFSAHLDFEIEVETFEAIKESVPLLEKISIERSFIEFDKLLTGPFWKKGLTYFIKSGAFDYLPDLENSQKALETLLENTRSHFVFSSSVQAWAALIISLEIVDVRTFLKKWKTAVHFQKDVLAIVDLYRLRLNGQFDFYQLYRYGQDLVIQAEELRSFYHLETDFKTIKSLESHLSIHDKSEIVVNGALLIKEFGLKPGPKLGDILKAIEDAIVMGQLANEQSAIYTFIRGEINE